MDFFSIITEIFNNFYIYPKLLKYDLQWQGFKMNKFCYKMELSL